MGLRDIFIKTTEQPASVAERRAASLPSSELALWTENCVIDIGRCLDLYRTTGKVEGIIEAEFSAQTALVLLAEMKRRTVS